MHFTSGVPAKYAFLSKRVRPSFRKFKIETLRLHQTDTPTKMNSDTTTTQATTTDEEKKNFAWLVRVALKERAATPNDRHAWLTEPNKYYAGAMPVFLSVGGDTTVTCDTTADAYPPTASMTNAWNARFEPTLPKWHLSAPSSFVCRILEDERAAVVKLALRRRIDSAYCTMSLHVLDLDSDMDKGCKKTIAQWMRTNKPTLDTVFVAAPGFETQFRFAHKLVDAAMRRGATDAFVISTGCKGYRVCVCAPELYVKVPVVDINGVADKQGAIKAAFMPTLTSYFGVSPQELDAALDWSVYGDNLGVRSNLHAHGATQLHPLVLVDGRHIKPIDEYRSMAYGAVTRDAASHQRIRDLWTYVVGRIPEDAAKDYQIGSAKSKTRAVVSVAKKAVVKVAPPSPPPNDECQFDREDSNDADDTHDELHRAPTTRPTKRGNDDVCGADKFDDIVQYLADKGWAAQPSTLTKAEQGARYVTVTLSKHKSTRPYMCPTRGNEHTHNNGVIRFDRSLGSVARSCYNEECEKARGVQRWEPMSNSSPGAHPLLALLLAGGLRNHFDIADLLADDTRDNLAYDTVHNSWRVYDQAKGTWRLVNSNAEALQRLRTIMRQRIDALVNVCGAHARRLPVGSRARKDVPTEQMQAYLQSSGSVTFLNYIATGCQSYLAVGRKQFERYFGGYLPTANYLLHFNVQKQRVEPLPILRPSGVSKPRRVGRHS